MLVHLKGLYVFRLEDLRGGAAHVFNLLLCRAAAHQANR